MRELRNEELMAVSGGSDVTGQVMNSSGQVIGQTTFCSPESIQQALNQFLNDPTIFGQFQGTSPFTITGGFNSDGSFTTNFDADNDGNTDLTVTVDDGNVSGNVDLGQVDIDFTENTFRINVGVGSNGALFLDFSEDANGGDQLMLGATLNF